MYGLFGFVEKLNIQNCVNSMGNCVHYTYGLSGFTQKQNSVDTLNVQNCINPTRYCEHQMYRLSRFAKNLDIHNCVISTGNWVRYMYIFFGFKIIIIKMNSVDMLKVQNCVDSKLCALDVRIAGFVENLNTQNCVNSTEIVYIICIDCLCQDICDSMLGTYINILCNWLIL